MSFQVPGKVHQEQLRLILGLTNLLTIHDNEQGLHLSPVYRCYGSGCSALSYDMQTQTTFLGCSMLDTFDVQTLGKHSAVRMVNVDAA